MAMRFALPVFAVGLAVGAVGGCSSNASHPMAQGSSTQIRPAQMETSECDQLVQRVQASMPTAKADRVPAAEADLHKAQELCRSGHPDQGTQILNRILGYMDYE